MKTKYRIYVLGAIPADLKERIVAIHAAGILKEKSEGIPTPTQATSSHQRGALSSTDSKT